MIKNSSVEKERSCASIHGSGTPAEHPCRAASPLNSEGILQGKVPLPLPQPCGVFSQGNSKGFAASHPGTLCVVRSMVTCCLFNQGWACVGRGRRVWEAAFFCCLAAFFCAHLCLPVDYNHLPSCSDFQRKDRKRSCSCPFRWNKFWFPFLRRLISNRQIIAIIPPKLNKLHKSFAGVRVPWRSCGQVRQQT